jgi:hypothetical protein
MKKKHECTPWFFCHFWQFLDPYFLFTKKLTLPVAHLGATDNTGTPFIKGYKKILKVWIFRKFKIFTIYFCSNNYLLCIWLLNLVSTFIRYNTKIYIMKFGEKLMKMPTLNVTWICKFQSFWLLLRLESCVSNNFMQLLRSHCSPAYTPTKICQKLNATWQDEFVKTANGSWIYLIFEAT